MVTTGPGAPDPPGRRITLVAGQGFALGLTTAWLTIPASAIFLAAYGSDLLPVTYIGAALAGIVTSSVLTRALRTRPIATVAAHILAGTAGALLLAWVALWQWQLDWVAFALLVLLPIVIPVGFVFLVGQAGALVDIRSLKLLYARVVAGFALGFVVGGLAGPVLSQVLGDPADLLLASALAACAFLALVRLARHRYPAELAVVETDVVEGPRPTLRAMSRDRYLVLLVAFQALSALESQLLDFLVYDGAAHRYQDASDLARFVGRFSAIAYGADILFLLLVAGLLLRRFGLRYGLTANPVGVLVLVLAITATTAVSGSFATVVFVLVVAARVTDLTLADGAARTSMSAAYQAVPARVRAVAQAAVEGIAVPVAIGTSGVVLLVLEAAGGTDGLALPVTVALVIAVWTVVAVLAYRQYGVSLLANLRGRTLDPSDLTLAEESSLIAIDRLVGSDDERDVRLGLDILTTARHPELPLRLERLVVDERVNVRTDALERLVRLAPDMAAGAARGGLTDPVPAVRAASLRVLAAAGHPEDRTAVERCARDPDPAVRVAVVEALSAIGDADARRRIVTGIGQLARSHAPEERALAARMLGVVRDADDRVAATVRLLLADDDPTVVREALASLRAPVAEELLADVVAHVGHPVAGPAAIDALVAAGPAALPVVDAGLGRADLGRRGQESLARVARAIGGPEAATVLRRHVGHPDREVGLAVMHALAAVAPTGTHTGLPGPGAAPDLAHATRVLAALVTLADGPGTGLLGAALRDELALARDRVLAALAVGHGAAGIDRVVYHLAQRDQHSHALALEWLEITLTDSDRAVVALLEPGRSERQRLQRLAQWHPQPARGRDETLVDLVRDPDGHWRRPWLAACALHTAAATPGVDLDLVLDAAAPWQSDDSTAGSIVAETVAGIRHRRLDPVQGAG